MRWRIGRRPFFFAALALVSAVLVPPTPAQFRWVAWFASGLALFWAVMLAADDLAAPTGNRRDRRRATPPTPFDPPQRPRAMTPGRHPEDGD